MVNRNSERLRRSDAQPRVDRSQRGEQDEAVDVDEIAQVRRLRCTRDPLNSTSYAQGDDSFREKIIVPFIIIFGTFSFPI